MEIDSSSKYVLITIWFQINHYHSSEKYANLIHRQGATHDLRGGKIQLYSKRSNGSLCVNFVIVQILLFIDWTCSTCQTGVQDHS